MKPSRLIKALKSLSWNKEQKDDYINSNIVKDELILKAITSQTPGKIKEELLIDAWNAGCIEFFKGAYYANSIHITFGVQKVPEIVDEYDDEQNNIFGWNEFSELLNKLYKRQLTGHAARDAIIEAANIADIDDWNYFYRAVLLKKLDCGCNETTINKALLKINTNESLELIIKPFCCQLAKSADDHKSKLIGEKLLDFKYDGVRLLSVLNKKENIVKQYTRNGIENNNFNTIKKDLSRVLEYLPINIVLDGEVISSSFQKLMTQVNRKEEIDTTDSILALFDLIDYDDWINGYSPVPQAKRHKNLCEILIPILNDNNISSIIIIPKLLVDLSTNDGLLAFEHFNRQAIDEGFEGIMIKDPLSPYEGKRTSSWLKIKPKISVDLNIINIIEGTGKYNSSLGAFVCKGIDDGREIQTNVGSGFTDEMRIKYWNNRNDLIGAIVEIEGDVLTIAENQTIWSLRFPTFKRFREIENNIGKI